jgi:hypothetical protein
VRERSRSRRGSIHRETGLILRVYENQLLGTRSETHQRGGAGGDQAEEFVIVQNAKAATL